MANYNTYVIDDELYVSVSTILGVEGADYLVKWALKTFDGISSYDAFMKSVSDLGTRLHHYVECDLKGEKYPDALLKEDMLPAIKRWHEWRAGKEIELIECEKQVYSKKWRVAGTCDMVLKIDGQLYIGDLKTGSVNV